MLVAGIVLLISASLMHCFYAANSRMRVGHAAGLFIRWHSRIPTFSILTLLIALALIWGGGSVVAALAAVLVYFLIFPLIFLPLLQLAYRPARAGETSHVEREESESEWAKVAGLDQPVKDAPTPNDFWLELHLLLAKASEEHELYVDLEAGALHRRVGWYPGPNHRMPVCCRVMREEMQEGDIVLGQPPKGVGASLVIRYFFPRPAA